ncbi:MAG TPA: beta-L-arabinofuranosidase domain-containing protein [Candidatus Limnocylindrales bacterium]|jgi:hypothetical protein
MTGLVVPSAGAISALRPLDAAGTRITGGFWADRQRVNRERSIPFGFEQLDRAGNFHNLRLAAGASGKYQALGVMFDTPFPFLDSDVYKWLEAAGWELGRGGDPALQASADAAIELVAKAQRQDGYLNTFVQVLKPGREYADLRWGHELYCYGHLIQAAVAWHRALGDDRLLEVALRAVGSVRRELGPDARQDIDGHPEIEMALVELYRVTGDRRHLELAAAFIDRRGYGSLGTDRFGAAYWQDHAPVREAETVAGHAVRQLYLDCGAVDVATELGDQQLLDAVLLRWRDMVATRSYLTGGVGSRHRDEAFGDPFELPPDQAYTESCAAIASVMLAWRLLLATGDPACADVIERTMTNGVLPGIGLDGTSFFYVNPLQRRTERVAAGAGEGERHEWYACACCPPNLMRTLSSFQQLLATTDAGGVQLHQYAQAEVTASAAGGAVRLSIATAYPWDGRVTVDVLEAPEAAWTLTLRRPAWAEGATVAWPGSSGGADVAAAGTVSRTGAWRAGDRVVLDLPMRPRLTVPDPRIDAVRGSVAVERGPVVYCVETADLPAGIDLEDVAVDPSAAGLEEVGRDDLVDGAVGLTIGATHLTPAAPDWPYRADPQGARPHGDTPIGVGAIPYFAWANREVAAMRVWLPTTGTRPTR